MQDKFDIKDFFNNIIAGILWLLLFWQLDFYFTGAGSFKFILNELKFFNNEFITGTLFLVAAFLFGTILRSLEWIPILFFELLVGNPLGWLFPEEKDKKNPCKIIKKRLSRFFCCECIPLQERIRDKVDGFFKNNENSINNDKQPIRKNQLIYLERIIELNGGPKIYERFKNYKNLIESIMLPFLVNCFFVLYKIGSQKYSPKYNCWLSIIMPIVAILLVFLLFNRYKYYKTEYYKQVFSSVLSLKLQKNTQELAGLPPFGD